MWNYNIPRCMWEWHGMDIKFICTATTKLAMLAFFFVENSIGDRGMMTSRVKIKTYRVSIFLILYNQSTNGAFKALKCVLIRGSWVKTSFVQRIGAFEWMKFYFQLLLMSVCYSVFHIEYKSNLFVLKHGLQDGSNCHNFAACNI